MLIVGLTAGAIAERWKPDRTMVAVSLMSAAVVMMPVIIGSFLTVTLGLLIATVVGLAMLRTFYAPALQSVVPTLVRNRSGCRRSTACSTRRGGWRACSARRSPRCSRRSCR